MKKKSIALMAIAVLMVASIATAYTLAFFTDKKEATNTFVVGDVKIKLEEATWKGQANEAIKATPGVAIPKDPTIANDGKNDAYVRMIVTVNHASVFGTDQASIKTAVQKIFCTNNQTGKIGENWREDELNKLYNYDKTKDTITFVYTYKDMLPKHDSNTDVSPKTTPLFTHVTLPADFDNKKMQDLFGNNQPFVITVVAEAIQADGFTADATNGKSAADAAFAALETQGANEAS